MNPLRTRRALGTILLALAAALPAAAADVWTADKAHSAVGFEIRHLVSRVHGRFDDFSGTITGDPAKPETASVAFAIKTASISTNAEKRDAHLKSPDFFDAEKNPEITFQSKSIKAVGKDAFEVTGALTMHGVTKDVTLKATLLGVAPDGRGGQIAGIEATTTLDRKDFGIVWNRALDATSTLLGDDVKVDINLELRKPAEKAAEKPAEKPAAPAKG